MILFDSRDEFPRDPLDHHLVVPARLASKTALLAFLKDALPLPAYFGGNWDALEECLNDPILTKGRRIVLAHHDLPPVDEPAEQRIYLRILLAAAGDSARLTAVFPARYEHILDELR